MTRFRLNLLSEQWPFQAYGVCSGFLCGLWFQFNFQNLRDIFLSAFLLVLLGLWLDHGWWGRGHVGKSHQASFAPLHWWGAGWFETGSPHATGGSLETPGFAATVKGSAHHCPGCGLGEGDGGLLHGVSWAFILVIWSEGRLLMVCYCWLLVVGLSGAWAKINGK